MSATSIREAIPELTRAIIAMVLAFAMVAASFVVPTGHAATDTASSVSLSASSDDGVDPEQGHAAAACHGCVVHAGAVLPASAFHVLQQVTVAELTAGDDISLPTPVRAPPVEPPRA